MFSESAVVSKHMGFNGSKDSEGRNAQVTVCWSRSREAKRAEMKSTSDVSRIPFRSLPVVFSSLCMFSKAETTNTPPIKLERYRED